MYVNVKMTNENQIYNNNLVEPTEGDPLRQDELSEEKEKLTFRKKARIFFANITIEPFLFLFIVANMIVITTSQNLYLDKACRVSLNYSQEICDSLRAQDGESQTEYERESQKIYAQVLTWKTYLSATIPSILALFAGSFSDKTGHRKVFMIVSATGMILTSINNMLNVYFYYQLSLQVLIFSEGLIEGLSGGWCLPMMTAFAYISAITTEKDRTYRMGLMSFCMTVAFPIGTSTSGILLKSIGFYGCYALTASLHLINLLYLIFVVKDPKRDKEQKKHDRRGICHLIGQFFNLENVKSTMSVLVRKAPNNRRVRLSVLLCVVSFLFGPMYGEISVMYMSTRYRFGWDEVKYSIFQTYNTITHTIGTVFSILVFSKHLQWHDSLLGIISTISKIAASFVYCFAPNERIFYIAPMVEILNGTSLLAMRSIITKLVEPFELGKVNALVGLVENMMPLLYVPLYTKVYTATMEVLPGAVFLLGSSMTLPAVIVLAWLFYDHRKKSQKIEY